MARSSVQAFQRLLEPPPPVENVRPVVRPRGGQLALVLAAGLFNGIVVQTEAWARGSAQHGRAGRAAGRRGRHRRSPTRRPPSARCTARAHR